MNTTNPLINRKTLLKMKKMLKDIDPAEFCMENSNTWKGLVCLGIHCDHEGIDTGFLFDDKYNASEHFWYDFFFCSSWAFEGGGYSQPRQNSIDQLCDCMGRIDAVLAGFVDGVLYEGEN